MWDGGGQFVVGGGMRGDGVGMSWESFADEIGSRYEFGDGRGL